ncbi:MAG: NAD(P)/FAD-dependent oxidoreductase [Thermoplasmatota archaeon]
MPVSPRNVAIIGSGPAGLTAAIYASRANLAPLVVSGYDAGGQLMITTDVENYPGFEEAIMGPDLMDRFRKQAARFGTAFLDTNVTKVDFTKRPFALGYEPVGEDKEGKPAPEAFAAVGRRVPAGWGADAHVVFARSVIIATGATAKWLNLPNEQRLRGHGVSACATCDGFFFKGKHVAVVGGGDTAMEEATFLTKFASKVTLIHRREEFRASKIMQQRVLSNPKVNVLWNTEVRDVIGKDGIEGLKLEDVKEKREYDFGVGGLFLAIGHKPNTELFQGILEMDANGYLKTGATRETHTSIPGVFIAGDVYDHRYRQAVTAAGSGCKAAIDAERWLEEHGH